MDMSTKSKNATAHKRTKVSRPRRVARNEAGASGAGAVPPEDELEGGRRRGSEGMAAVDVPRSAGDEARLGPRQKRHGIGDVVGLAVVADRSQRPHGVGELAGVGIRVGLHRTGLDGVDGDATGPEFTGKAAGQSSDSGLRERVDGDVDRES